MFATHDLQASSAKTRKKLGWNPTGPGLIADLEQMRYHETDRKRRADAQRNRERILEVARQEFTRVRANASLEEIAKKAGVGPGTLFRHFATREDLLVAVYRSEVEKPAAAERTLAESKSPVEALR